MSKQKKRQWLILPHYKHTGTDAYTSLSYPPPHPATPTLNQCTKHNVLLQEVVWPTTPPTTLHMNFNKKIFTKSLFTTSTLTYIRHFRASRKTSYFKKALIVSYIYSSEK